MNTEELRRLLEAATPGPWAVTKEDRDGERWVATAEPHKDLDGAPMYIAACSYIPGAPNQYRANTALIAAAVNALPGLLDALDLARALVESPLCPDSPEARALRAALGLPEGRALPEGWRL